LEAIDENHPGYIRELYRYAERTIGPLATWRELADTVNFKSAVPGEERPTLSVSRRQLAAWFAANNGKEVSAIEKPLLTSEHRQQRVEWARRWFDTLRDPLAPVAFLDEKWFYTTNRRRKLKVLPKNEEEAGQPVPYRRPRIRSRRYPVKVMYLGVVAAPRVDYSFDGRVCLHRVSRRKTLARASRNKRYSVDVLVVEAIVRGEWHNFVAPGSLVGDVLESIKTNYDLDEYVCNRLVMGYETYTAGGNKKWKPLNENDVMDQLGVRTDSEGNQIPLELRDLELFVQQAAGDEVDEDVSCDSTFMLEKIPAIGGALREKFHWVPENETIYLFMDNAGGHGTNDAIQEYTNRLWADYKVQIVWQVPRSPETNMLDLGVWMSIQAAVTRVHYMRRCHHDALARSVEEAWNSYLSPLSFERVHRRLRVVLTCIVDDKGGNELVESKRGKLFRDATIIDLTDDGEEEGANANLIDDLEDLVDEDEV